MALTVTVLVQLQNATRVLVRRPDVGPGVFVAWGLPYGHNIVE